MFQSARHGRYDEIIDQLYRAGDLYWCRCTRREIMAAGGSTTVIAAPWG
jgi:glutamyl-Q tRNA(Asp) synthetase